MKLFLAIGGASALGTVHLGLNFFSSTIVDAGFCEPPWDNVTHLLASNGTLLTSQDLGHSFTTKRGETPGDAHFRAVVRDSQNGSFMLLVTKKGALYASFDCGQRFTSAEFGMRLTKVRVAPHAQVLLLLLRGTTSQLWLWEQAGKPQFLLDNVVDAVWSSDGGILAAFHHPEVAADEASWHPSLGLALSHDGFLTRQELSLPANRLVVTHGRVYCSVVTDSKMKHVKLYHLHAARGKLTAKLVRLPQPRLQQHGFTFLKLTGPGVALHVTHRRSARAGTLYFSRNGINFVEARKLVARSSLGLVDAEHIRGLNSTLLVNAYDQLPLRKKQLRTYISYDSGATWDTLAHPSGLHLHLHGKEVFSPPSSTTRVPGVMLANGNEGKFLGESPSRLWLTLDAGRTWNMKTETSCLGAITGDGNILLAIEEGIPARHLRLSIDDGQTFRKIPLSEDPFRAVDLLAHPTLPVALVHGVQHIRGKAFGFVMPLNFTQFSPVQCTQEELLTMDLPARSRACIGGYALSVMRKRAGVTCGVASKGRLRVLRRCACSKTELIRSSHSAQRFTYCIMPASSGSRRELLLETARAASLSLLTVFVLAFVRRKWKAGYTKPLEKIE